MTWHPTDLVLRQPARATEHLTETQVGIIKHMAACCDLEECLTGAELWEPTIEQRRDAVNIWRQGRMLAICAARQVMLRHDPFGYLRWATENGSPDIKPRLEAVK